MFNKCLEKYNAFHVYVYTGCERFGLIQTEEMGVYLPDGCKLYDDDEVVDEEIVGNKMLFLGENPPTCKTMSIDVEEGNFLFLGFCICMRECIHDVCRSEISIYLLLLLNANLLCSTAFKTLINLLNYLFQIFQNVRHHLHRVHLKQDPIHPY